MYSIFDKGELDYINDYPQRDRLVVKLETPVCTEKQANYAIQDFVSRCGVDLNALKLFLNYGTNRSNKYAGFCTLWLGGDFKSAYKVYKRLLNLNSLVQSSLHLNSFGQERVEFTDANIEKQFQREYESGIENINFERWAADVDVESLHEELYQKYKQWLRPKRAKTESARFFLTRQQRAQLRTNAKYGQFKASAIYLTSKVAPSGSRDDVLFAQRINDQLSTDYFHQQLQCMCDHGYQLEEFRKRIGRCIKIHFDSKTDSLLFRTMFRKLLVPIGRKAAVVIFNYSFE